MIIFSKQLKSYRAKKGISQEELAQQLNVTRQAISKWEAGESSPDIKSLVKLSNIFNISLDQLVLGTSSSKTSKIDNSQFTYDPNKDIYVRKLGSMNIYEFLASYWWAIAIIVAIIGGSLSSIIK